MIVRLCSAFWCLAWLGLICLTGSGLAKADCPNRETAKNGFTLFATKQAATVDVAPFVGSLITYTVTPAGSAPVTVVSQDGLFDLSFRSQGSETTTAYSIDVASAEPFKPDTTLNFDMTSTGPDGKQLLGAIEQRVVDHETIEIGECRYETIVIQASSRFAGTPFKSRRRINYSPDLKMVVRAEFRTNDGRRWVQEYQKIQPR